MAPFLKENEQLPDADDVRCIGSQCSAEQTIENTQHHPQRRAQDARKHNHKELFWELKKSSDEGVSDKSMSSPLCFAQRSTESLGLHEECCKVFLEKTIRHHLRIHDMTIFRKLDFLF